MTATFGIESEKVVRVGHRRWPLVECELVDLRLPDTKPFNVRRVLVAHETGWALSLIWGSATYSSNHDHPLVTLDFTEEPTCVEAAVVYGDDLLGEPMRRVTPEQVNICLDSLALLPSSLAEAAIVARDQMGRPR